MKELEISLEELFYISDASEICMNEIVNIEKLNIFVKTPTNDFTLIKNLVRKKDKKIRLKTGLGDLVCGENHLILTENGIEKASEAETVIDCIGVSHSVYKKSKRKIEDNIVYDIGIDYPHLYVTPNGMIHHNTTVAKAMLKELDCDYIVINGSMNGNIDTLRNEIQNYASSVSFSGSRKYVILDEADYINGLTQAALRNFMEEFSKNCGFILTANFANKIIEPLHSRCAVIDFKISKKDMAKLAVQFFKRVQMILEKENIQYDKKVVSEVIQKYFPDWRRILNELQRYSATGSIDSGILSNLQEVSLNDLVKLLKDKKFSEIRKWVAENLEDSASFFRAFYDNANTYFKPSYIPMLILTIAKYQYQSAFSIDQDINTVAFLVEVMIEADYVG